MSEPKIPRPADDREPSCIHSGWYNGQRVQSLMQPASACRICKDGPELAKWKSDWAAWLAQNPDSPEARLLLGVTIPIQKGD